MTTYKSIFAPARLWADYDVSFQFTGRLAGSIPHEATAVLEMVARQGARASGAGKVELDREEWLRRSNKFLEETGQEALTREGFDAIVAEKAQASVNVFRRNGAGLYLASHSIKAAIKEAMNVLYAKEPFGRTRKGGTNFVAERVFVMPDAVPLLTSDGSQFTEEDGIDTINGTVSGPLGKRPIVTRHQYIVEPHVNFTLRVLSQDGADQQAEAELAPKWETVLSYMEQNGIGPIRKFGGYGCFVVTSFQATVQQPRGKKTRVGG